VILQVDVVYGVATRKQFRLVFSVYDVMMFVMTDDTVARLTDGDLV